jgi:nucleoside-diphosphate-sugar epimerase
MRVFVTGGSGFIGRRLVSALLEAGDEVICLSRSGKSSADLASSGAEVLSGDLTSADSLNSAIAEARPTHVAHLAAEIATQRNAQQVERVNVDGTRALMKASAEAELERFLFLSTVVRGMAQGETFTEKSAIPATTAYGKSKERCDQMLLEAHRETGFPAVILRPSHVYGPGGWFAELATSKLFRIPGPGDNYWDMVHVDDVVSACMLLLREGPVGEVFHVVDDTPVTMKAFFAAAAEALGRKPFGHVPAWVAKVAKGSSAIESAVRSARSSNAKLKGIGWEPAHPDSLAAVHEVIAEIRGDAEAAGSL